jgi:hypothetical protein
MSELSDADKVCVQKVSELQNAIAKKLASLSVLENDTIWNIAHHLAEVCLSGRKIDQLILPRLLNATPSAGRDLAVLSHDLMTELDEIREGIEEMNDDVIALMNAFNK